MEDWKKKTYTPAEVEQIIVKLRQEYEKNLSAQKDRILELRAKLNEQETQLEEYRSRSRQINEAIMAAVAKAEELEKTAKLKYDMEIKGLKLFHSKWLKYYERILEKYPLDDELIKVAKFNERMNEALGIITEEFSAKEDDISEESVSKQSKEVSEAIAAAIKGAYTKPSAKTTDAELQYEEETRRLSNASEEKKQEEQWNPVESIKEYYEGKPLRVRPQIPKGAIDMEEALHPKMSLEEILKELL